MVGVGRLRVWAFALCVFPGVAHAGAWPIEPGRTQAIVKLEHQSAADAFDATGAQVPIAGQRDDMVSMFFEHGLTSRLTLQGKLSLEDGQAGGVHFRGRGPVELGVRALLFRRRNAVASLYVGGVVAGAGLNAFYAPPGAGQGDLEVRLLLGDSGEVLHRHVFEQVEIAHLRRRELPDEVRFDTTFGLDISSHWMVMAQSYAGSAMTAGPDPKWFKGEASIVRRFGDVRVQVGWRQALYGREAPREHGPVVALWKSF